MTPRMVGCRAAARESLQKCGSRLKRARPPPHAAARAIMSAMVRSFYFRIGFSFVVFVVAVLLAQNAMFSYVLSRSGNPLPPRPPNNLAAIVSADIASTLAQDPGVDVSAYL